MTELTTVLIADSHHTGMTSLLIHEPGIKVVGQASNEDEAIEKTLKLKPNVLLIDAALYDV